MLKSCVSITEAVVIFLVENVHLYSSYASEHVNF